MVKNTNVLATNRPVSIGCQFGLFKDYKYPLSPIQNNETLYNWCARIHRLCCSSNARNTCMQLFGHATCGLKHDFPGNINQLVKNTSSAHLPEFLAANHTSLSFFRPFLRIEEFDKLLQYMISSEGNHIKGLLGLSKGGVGTPFPLKTCPDCVIESRDNYGLSLWDIHYQWPTFRICPIHQRSLFVAPENFHKAVMKQWFLPHDIDLNLWECKYEFNQQTSKILAQLATWSIFLQRYNGNPLEPDILRLLYHLQAKNIGFTTLDGSLKFKQLRVAFIQRYQSIFQIKGFEFLQRTNQEHGGFIGLLLRDFQGNRFPIKHIFLMDYLFDSPESFGEYYQHLKNAKLNHTLSNIENELTSTRRVLENLVKSGSSINAAALSLGVNVATAFNHIRDQHIDFQKRPRVLTSSTEAELIHFLKVGLNRKIIIKEMNIKKGFLTKYLNKNTSLKACWSKANFNFRRNEYREKFISLLNDNPTLPINKIRKISKNGFEWLLYNDLEWLKQQLPCIWRR